jgi:hypothetical protein
MDYFEAPRPPGDGLCSDNQCPCTEELIPRGKGYLYVSPELVELRKDALSYKAVKVKLERARQQMIAQTGAAVLMTTGSANPILMCEQGARLRKLDLKVAATDAAHWWETGLVPLRVSPCAPASQTATGDGKTLEEAIRVVQAQIPGEAINVSQPVPIRKAEKGIYLTKAHTQKEAENQLFYKYFPQVPDIVTVTCLVPARTSLFGLIKTPGNWQIEWERTFRVQITYQVPNN